MSKNNLEPIAVVGIGAIMPGALSKDEFWKNITEGKNSIIEVPQDRWDYRLFYSEDRSAPDKTYTKIGGFITGFKFNSLKYRIPPSVAKQMDSIQHLALETASMALEDAGYDKKDFDRSRTAVIIANAMGGIKNEYSNTRIYKAFYYDMLRHSEHFAALPPAEQEAIIEDVEASVNAKFLPITEDSMPGELPNVISGRVANVFNFNGTSFSIDAACASSIAALDQAVNGLRVGNYDMALCGGVDQMMSPAAYIKFCKIGALSADGSFAFDARANGFVMAEGAGMVILKRLSDAERDGDKIYGVIRAIGASSDGKGKGITAPNPKGQKLAIENTFKQLDYTPGEVGLMEAHGTATKVGDATELAALDEVFKPYAPAGSIGLGSIKSQIGHAKAAAGIASVIKVMLALHNKVLPPSINFETPNPIVDWASTPFKVITQARPWETDKIRRANVSSFGFGGTNFHLAAEEYHPALSAKKAAPSAISENQENKTMAQTQNAAGKYELLVPMEKLQGDMLVFSGESKQDLFNELNQAVQSIQGDPLYLIKAAYKNHTASYKQYAVSINAESPAKLKEKIEFFIKTASSSDVWSEPSLYLKMKGIYPFYNHSEKPKVCFMFPGQGSQYVDMMKDLASKYKVVRDTFAEADVILKEIAGMTLTDVIWSKEGESKEEYKKREEGIKQTQITQPAILTANVAMMRLLYQFGIKPDVTMGHSLGEYGAAVAAGVLSFPDAIRAVTTRGTAMANIKVPDCGKMAAIAASVDKIEPELKKISGYVAVANKNCPTQTVIAGESKSVDDAVALFTSMGIQSVLVPVSHAFHSAIVRPASAVYREFLNGLTINAPKLPITSNVSADFYPSDPSKIRDMMVEQIMSSVEWIKQVELAYARGVRLFIEVGPKRVLSAFVTSTLSDKKDIRVLASNHPKRGGITEFNDLMANLVAAGIWIDWSKTDMNKEETIFNPAFVAAAGFKAPAQEASASVCACAAPAKNPCEVQVAISGIAAGTPGSWQKVFRDGNLDEILQGKNFIENISVSEQERQISKNIEYVVKSRVGNHRVEKLTDVSQSVKLAAKKGEFDLEKEFGVPAKWVKSMDPSFTLAIAAGILALKDAGIPLVLYYKPTTAGTYLPDRWGLPQNMIDDTGVIFTSAFPTVNSWAFEVSTKVADALIGKTKKEVRAFYEQIINSISDESLKAQIKAWFEEKFAEYEHHNARVFSQDFLLKAIPIAHSQFCQWIRARGPATHLSGACASTAQAISVAEDWIKLGRAKRVIIIAADDVTNNVIQEWILAGFLASGAVSREADVTKAALPFDRRRNGMIVGMGAAGLVVEAEEEIRKRGMTPLTRLLATEITNSAFHPTRIDVNHVAEVMDRMMSKAEKKYGLSRSDMSKEMVFISHETYTPARGGSASAEVFALKNTFKGDVENVIVSNTKGFTGHSMGAGLEDVIAVHSLNTGNVPPIANYKEPDPELAGINLSKGGHYNFKYALRLAAGFGSQLSMTLQEKTWSEGTPRIIDQAKYMNWLKEASNQEAPVLEVVNNTLRIKDNYQAGKKPALVMEASQAFVDKAAAGHLHTQAEQAPAAQPVAAPVAAQPAVAPAPAKKLDEATVTEEIVNLISEKTGYPKDMLELDLDMEADLGIDTVKQAELFAAMREMYNLPQAEGIQLKDYPTIRHCINYALSASNNAGNTSTAPAPIQTVQASAPVTPAVTPVTVQPAPAPAAQPVAAPVAAQPAVAPAPAKKLDEATVTEEIVNLISEKTGYPKDMLELDLDMEADLGIDTVKQAELFAAMREMYNLPQAEGIQLKDYPTIRHCINYALSASNNAGNTSTAPAQIQTVQASAPVTPAVTPVTVQPAPAPAAQPVASAQPAPVSAPAKKLDEATVTEEIVNLISEKTGYPKDMLELDLDMEADLGIDTVKQAELFAAMREMYNLPQAEGIQLKDYPTIRHCINYALNASSGAAPVAAAAPVQTVQASAPVTPAVTPVTVQPAPAPAAQPVAAQPAVASVPDKKLDEATVTEEIVNLIAEKTGYPKDMLELDLDMEADLGIDTVKQAELFAAMREMYNLPQAEGIQLKDYPTIRYCINYALSASNNASNTATAPAPAQTVQASAPVTPAVTPVTVQPAPAVQPAAVSTPAPVVTTPVQAPAAKGSSEPLDEAKVTEEIVNLIAEKTGYPKDMLELDLDMEADLGIDTVKQAELFAAMREMYNLPQAEGIQLKDYPTIRHCINYALNASKAPAAQPAVEAAPAAQQTAPVEQNAPAAQPAAEAAPAPVPAVTEPKQYEGEDSHNKKLRFIPTLVDAPLTSEANRRLSADRTVLIFSDSAALTRAYVDAFKALGVKTHIFTTLKTRSKNTTIVNWDSLEETTAALEQYAKENPGAVQGIVYLLPCSIKKFDKKINPHADLTKFLMPLFMACKVFVKDMSKRDDADTFLSVVFKVDGAFAYKTKEAISPTIGSVCGAANCLRKDFYQIGGVFSKIMDFEASAEPEYMAEKTIHELLKGDDRGMVSYYQGNRSTLFSVPRKLNMSRKHMDLTGKTVAFTGAGRGLGAILSQKLASQYKARVLILDIIELTDKTPYWATLNEAELKELKQKMWLDMKADTSVRATPVMLERAFGKVKDSITLYKNMQKIKALGGDVDYYQCDVTNGSMMKDVVTRIKAKYGKVDGLIHFAGFEKSKLFTDKTTDEYYRTFDIKATSAAAFVALNFVKDTGFYAFASSIAGKYGNLGQSDYASANDFLAKLCISLHNQGQRAVSIDMSAYANVGMGVRPGVVEFLTSHGVKFVDPYDGMQIFLNEIVYGRVPEIVLTDDLGELDLDGQVRINDPFILEEETEEGGNTPSGGNGGDKGGASSSAPAEQPAQESVKQPEAETENFFLGEVKNLSAGKEIAAENTFNAEYPFLFDHAIEGTPYVPGVMGIETFMETASMLEGKTPQGLEDVHFYLPIKLLRRRPQSVRIKGVNEGGKVSMEIESDFINSKGVKMGNTRRHFTARVLEHFESKWNNYKNKFDFGTSGFAVTKEEIYSKFFHGPSFQVLGGILKIDENAVLGVYEKPSQVLFHDGPKHLLAYPMLIEACFQTCGYRDLAVENRMTLPDSIGKIYIHGKGEAPNKLYTLAVFTGKNIEGKSIYDGFVFDEKGKLWIELSDYQMIGQ